MKIDRYIDLRKSRTTKILHKSPQKVEIYESHVSVVYVSNVNCFEKVFNNSYLVVEC